MLLKTLVFFAAAVVTVVIAVTFVSCCRNCTKKNFFQLTFFRHPVHHFPVAFWTDKDRVSSSLTRKRFVRGKVLNAREGEYNSKLYLAGKFEKMVGKFEKWRGNLKLGGEKVKLFLAGKFKRMAGKNKIHLWREN